MTYTYPHTNIHIRIYIYACIHFMQTTTHVSIVSEKET